MDMVGEKLGSFRIEDTLGAGAMGVVYKAVHEPSGRIAAVKVIHSDAAGRGKAYERFQREAEILQQFRHPNIVRFLAMGRYKGTSYFAMEFVKGRTLDQVLEESGALPWRDVAEYALQLCDALHYAHEHGVVHRDLKPSNLMVTEDRKLKLTDFGIARDLDKTALTADGRTLGTAAYMAPEQIRGITSDISHKTDLYAMGVVLFQMLTGKMPFEGSSAMAMMHGHLQIPPPRPSSKILEIPKALDDLVVKLMAKEQTNRPWDAAAVGEVLKKILEPAKKGETVPMVWPTEDAAAATAATSVAEAQPAAKKKKKGTKARSGYASQDFSVDSPRDVRRMLETGGLLAAMLVILAVLVWSFWPASASYLYKKADALMASEDRHKWMEAIERYVDPLDQKYPDNPYKETTQRWRDKLALVEVEGRARQLDSEVKISINEPKDDNEKRYAQVSKIARARRETGNDAGAKAAWDELASQVDPKSSADRRWHLLAKKNADEIAAAIKTRRETVEALFKEALIAEREGRTDEARAMSKRIIEEYGKYKDVADMLGPVPSPGAPAPEPAPVPAATPADEDPAK